MLKSRRPKKGVGYEPLGKVLAIRIVCRGMFCYTRNKEEFGTISRSMPRTVFTD